MNRIFPSSNSTVLMSLVYVIFLSFNTVFGQTGLVSTPATIKERDSLTVELEDVQNSPYVFYYRALLSGQVVDLFSVDNQVYHGTITNSTKSYEDVEKDNIHHTMATKLYTSKVDIDSTLASSIAHQIIASGQLSIPTDTLIDSWTRWYLHCGSLNFEFKQDNEYVEQSFHCPWNQPDTVAFKEIIISNYNLLHQTLQLDSVYQNFLFQLPKGQTYSMDGYRMIYLMTVEQEEARKKDKPRRDYLASIKDTIDSYLRMKLEGQHINDDDVSCFDDYYLTFKENGKLWKLEVSDYGKPRLFDGIGWYLEDKKEFRQCKRRIKKMFKEIDLSSFHLQYKLYRTISFGFEGEVELRDDTIY